MAKFMIRASYTARGIAGLGKEGGTARAEVVRALIENAGGQVESLYFALGEDDLYVVSDVPDNVTAASLSIAVRAAGGVQVVIAPLLAPEEIDAAARMPVMYQAPGQ